MQPFYQPRGENLQISVLTREFTFPTHLHAHVELAHAFSGPLAMWIDGQTWALEPGDTAIDIGTGTGILAIAAALAGAKDVLATDLDPVAVRVAAENVRINGFADVIRTRQGDLLQAVVVIANIIADVIAMLAQPVRAHIEDGGLFICSGIARERSDFVIEALKAAGYQQPMDIREKGEWMAIAARK